MSTPRHTPATVPSRVVAVRVLREMGVEFQPDNSIPETSLAEVRPHSPRGMLPLISDETPLFYAEAEVESRTYRAVFGAPDGWFRSQFPLSILLNIPNDPAAIALPAPRVPAALRSCARRGEKLIGEWGRERTPRVATLNYLQKMTVSFPHLLGVTACARALLATSAGPLRSADDRDIVVTTLHDVVRELAALGRPDQEAA